MASFLQNLRAKLKQGQERPTEERTRLEFREGTTSGGGNETAQLVMRDQRTNRPVRVARADYSTALSPTEKQKTWRAQLREMTDNGKPLFQTLYNLSQGVPIVVGLPDGRESLPVLPSPETMRGSATDLLHMLHGKPVAQTEVTKAEEDAGRLMQVQAMSDEDLLKVINGEVTEKRELPEPEEET